MTLRQLKKLINDTKYPLIDGVEAQLNNQDIFDKFLSDESNAKIANIDFKFIHSERSDSDFLIIFQVEDILYRIDGSYCSYEGSEFHLDTIRVVTKQEKTITVYRKPPKNKI